MPARSAGDHDPCQFTWQVDQFRSLVATHPTDGSDLSMIEIWRVPDVYTDYGNASRLDAARHNRTTIRDGSPDLVAGFDYFRFRRPGIPTQLRGRAFSDSAQVSDAELLQFLGADAD